MVFFLFHSSFILSLAASFLLKQGGSDRAAEINNGMVKGHYRARCLALVLDVPMLVKNMHRITGLLGNKKYCNIFCCGTSNKYTMKFFNT